MLEGVVIVADPRVWVGCLGCYNAGALVGAWVDALEAESVTVERLHAGDNQGGVTAAEVLEADPYAAGHEELWCLDHEGFGGVLEGECSPSEAQRIAEALAEVESDGYALEAVSAWLGNTGERLEDWDAPTRERFEDAFAGEWPSGADYAEDLAGELGILAGSDLGGTDLESTWPLYCIDWERAWRELELGDGYWTAPAEGGGVYVFRS